MYVYIYIYVERDAYMHAFATRAHTCAICTLSLSGFVCVCEGTWGLSIFSARKLKSEPISAGPSNEGATGCEVYFRILGICAYLQWHSFNPVFNPVS